MRIAILILAHKNINQLKRLVSRLSEDFNIYIHIDKKSTLDVAQLEAYPNVKLIERQDVNWGSHHQIIATHKLFQAAYADGNDYFMLISGQDIPIKSNQYIKDYIQKNANVSFVNHEALPKPAWAEQEGGYGRLHYYWGDDFKQNTFGLLLKKVFAVVRKTQIRLKMRRKLYPIKFYGGWNWINMNREAMACVLDYVEKNPAFLEHFKYTRSGDEIWVQTILANTPSINIMNDDLRLVKWVYGSEHPLYITADDKELISKSDALFARKVDENVDGNIIDHIYEATRSERLA
ncbi:hypothetical protein KHS38_00400 [Mucilaginibacter sp. Bleaf8]|uniref:beta-1,6-N-acetylglucosaminyltransferase n=1 Tax=Mucilaginibacter sp. Bleaf8 TaxID=2834430 RepID=UPI001BD12903|nr:beta-1,6-N-acetylglucosaminyltransferase [Mucilaginibacter sp. Bleaf8]MBS7562850.1 hypothetical protein [Mucilaginibacter sp. Bleaf8]